MWQIVDDLEERPADETAVTGRRRQRKNGRRALRHARRVANKMQAALLAPTEVLAEQHFLTLANLLHNSSVNIELLTSRTRRQSKGRRHAAALAGGGSHLAVGTQALLQEDIEFANLGLVVVDEQHRAGRSAAGGAHRARAHAALSGDDRHADPANAGTVLFRRFRRERHRRASARPAADRHALAPAGPGGRGVAIRPRTGAAAAPGVYRRAADRRRRLDDGNRFEGAHAIAGRRPVEGACGWRHCTGKCRPKKSSRRCPISATGKIDVLVATTVIEVGIDVPNATVMVIDGADRFGLSQLHQLRGRVGRGSKPSHCILISDAANEGAEARLRAMPTTTDGFEIAEMDLRLRGPGEFFGTRQHGLPEFKLADVTSELDLLQLAKEDAQLLLADDAKLSQPGHASLRKALLAQFGKTMDLVQVG